MIFFRNEVIGSDPVWIGHIETYKVAKWIDSFMMLIFGGLPWQAYFQRVLTANSGSFIIKKIINVINRSLSK